MPFVVLVVKCCYIGANFDEAKAKAIELSKSKHMTFIPPFDHPLVIAGQGTLAMEMLQQVADLDYVFCASRRWWSGRWRSHFTQNNLCRKLKSLVSSPKIQLV